MSETDVPRSAAEQAGIEESEPQHANERCHSRRNLLRGAGLIAGGIVAGTAGKIAWDARNDGVDPGSPYMPEEWAAPEPRKQPGFDHLVVLMGENRSFDNLLGYLYTPDDPAPRGQAFEGLDFGDYSNVASDGTVVPAHRYHGNTDRIMAQPDPDPGEEYPHVNTQVFGEQNAHNAGKDVGNMTEPYNSPSADAKPTMGGFVLDYETDFQGRTGKKPTAAQRDQIMGSFDPTMLPALSTLAKEFGVFDHWYCAVPSQTFCNRSFFHASTSHGFVTNKHGGGYRKWLDAASTPTVFNRLEESGLSWRIYFDELQLVSFTGVLHAPVLERYWKTEHFAGMEQFYEDVKNGNLPAYAFVEPRMIFNHNDFHPPVGKPAYDEANGQTVEDGAYSDVRAGDALVSDVYNAIRTSTTKGGSNYLNTALLITFDEHGGTYDHVAPPVATPPDDSGKGEMGFEFNRLGCRVPAIFVSAHTERGSVFSDEMHHGSLAATLSERFGLASLTRRDHGAPTFTKAFNRKRARHLADWPQTTAQFVPPNPEDSSHPAKAHPHRELSPPAHGLVGLLLERYGTAAEKTNPPQTFGEAYDLLVKHGQGLFGVSS